MSNQIHPSPVLHIPTGSLVYYKTTQINHILDAINNKYIDGLDKHVFEGGRSVYLKAVRVLDQKDLKGRLKEYKSWYTLMDDNGNTYIILLLGNYGNTTEDSKHQFDIYPD